MNNIDLYNNNLAIFGVGLHAQRCLYLLNTKNIDIECYFDNRFAGKTFRGKKVLEVTTDNLRGKLIIIAVSAEKYQSVRVQLIELGLKEFCDFIYYKLIDHKMVILYGNCHIEIMKAMLQNSKKFSCIYSFYPLPVIMEIDSSILTEDILTNCDLFLGQDIRDNNPFGELCSTSKIVSRLSSTCDIYIIPNLYGLGTMYFPQYKKDFNKHEWDGFYINGKWDQFGFFPFSDSIIDDFLRRGMDDNSIISQCVNGKHFSADEIEKCFDDCIKKIREREKNWSIKCSDYIEENFKFNRLFYEPEHPTNVMFEYICQEMLKLFDISDEVHTNINLGYYETPIYPEVKEILGLKFETEIVRMDNNERSLNAIESYAEYVKQYLWWRRGYSFREEGDL